MGLSSQANPDDFISDNVHTGGVVMNASMAVVSGFVADRSGRHIVHPAEKNGSASLIDTEGGSLIAKRKIFDPSQDRQIDYAQRTRRDTLCYTGW